MASVWQRVELRYESEEASSHKNNTSAHVYTDNQMLIYKEIFCMWGMIYIDNFVYGFSKIFSIDISSLSQTSKCSARFSYIISIF